MPVTARYFKYNLCNTATQGLLVGIAGGNTLPRKTWSLEKLHMISIYLANKLYS